MLADRVALPLDYVSMNRDSRLQSRTCRHEHWSLPTYSVPVKLGSFRIKCGLASYKISKLASAKQTSSTSTRFILTLITKSKSKHLTKNLK